MKVKQGRIVLLPNDKVGVISTLGGQAQSSFVMPNGDVDQGKDIPHGMALCHEIDEAGESVMVKHPTQMRFITLEHLFEIAKLRECPADRIPASRSQAAE